MTKLGWSLIPFVMFALFSTESSAGTKVNIRTINKIVSYEVEIADTAIEKLRGLMFREELSASSGMVFLYDPPRNVSFWMVNVKIPLDILFIDACGKIIAIHPMAMPGDPTIIESPDAVSAVLEIAGGSSNSNGIRTGDRVSGVTKETCNQ